MGTAAKLTLPKKKKNKFLAVKGRNGTHVICKQAEEVGGLSALEMMSARLGVRRGPTLLLTLGVALIRAPLLAASLQAGGSASPRSCGTFLPHEASSKWCIAESGHPCEEQLVLNALQMPDPRPTTHGCYHPTPRQGSEWLAHGVGSDTASSKGVSHLS